MKTANAHKAIALLSGGLDSLLAAKIVKDAGIDVIGLHLLSPFGCREDVKKVAETVGIPLIIKDKGEAYLELVKKPKYGYGSAMNPCIDCRIYMFQMAEIVMEDEGAQFIITGEVLGQRPMSQQRTSIDLIDRKSGIEDRILRPLSAHLFEPSLPEREGWIDRKSLFAMSGRTRKEQLALVEKYGITAYSAPGGGCLLTETSFSSRLKDFYTHEHHENADERMVQSELLRFGRHFRISEKTKVIVARNQQENGELESRWNRARGVLFVPVENNGPSAILLGSFGETEKSLVGELIARYSKGKGASQNTEIHFETKSMSGNFVVTQPMSEERLEAYRL